MNSTIKSCNALLQKTLQEMSDSLVFYEKLPKEKIFSLCLQKRLDYTLSLYDLQLQESVDYLSAAPAGKVFKEVNFQQKKAYKERQELLESRKAAAKQLVKNQMSSEEPNND